AAITAAIPVTHRKRSVLTGRRHPPLFLCPLSVAFRFAKRTQFAKPENDANYFAGNMFRVGTASPTKEKRTQTKPIDWERGRGARK
ncbi:MAG: hypothetical protein ACYSOF_01060, partial [Planctomycetota bacterium]